MSAVASSLPAPPAQRALRLVQRAPLTVTLVALAWAGALVAGGPGPAPARIATGLGALADGRWWTVLTAAGWWGGVGAYVVTTVLVSILGAVAERRIGALRTLALLLGTQAAGILVALGLVAIFAGSGGGWAADLAGQQTVGAAPGAVGLGLAVSTRLSALWRRRLRLLLLVAAGMLVAYSGELPDVVLLCSALVGLVIGPVVLRSHRRRVGPVSGPESRVLVALLVAASAVGPVVAAVAAAPIGPLAVLQFVVLSPPPDLTAVQQICDVSALTDCRELQAQLRLSGVGPALASAVPVLLLLVVAEGLRRGRRAAWAVGIALNLTLAGLGVFLAVLVATTPAEQLVVYGGAPEARHLLGLVLPPALPLAVAVLLWKARARFTVPAPAGIHRRLVRRVAAVLVGLSVLYVLGGVAVADQFQPSPTVGQLLADLPLRFLPPGYLGEVEPTFLPQGPLATLLFEWTGPLFWLVVGGALLVGFVRPRVEAGDEAGARARELLVTRGGANLAWMTTWAGNAHWLAEGPGGAEAAVAYRVIGSVAVTVGDPVGAPDTWSAAVAGFASFSRERGWTPAFYSVTAPTRAACTALGWSHVQVAEETVLSLPGLSFSGRRWQDVRTALNRAAATGVTAAWIRFADAPLAITDQIRAINEEWVADKGLPEMGFTLGGLDEMSDDAVRCLVAVDAHRTVHGVTSWLPVHRAGRVIGWTLDLMRRRSSGGFRPVMEFLIASAAQDLRDEGFELLSLSGAPLARVPRGEPPTGLQRLLDVVGGALEPVYGFRSLLAFKAKFQPCYEPLYLTYPDPAALPAIGLAIGRAYLPHLTARQTARLIRRLGRP